MFSNVLLHCFFELGFSIGAHRVYQTIFLLRYLMRITHLEKGKGGDQLR